MSAVQAPAADAARRFGQALAALEAELDWPRLGAAYCEGDARGFFDGARRERLLEVGLRLADDVAAALPRGGPGRSLYVGAALAELAPLLAERLVLAREVVWLNLPGPELDELSRALDAVAARLDLELPRPRACAPEALPAGAFDHVWLVSVLTDPDAFPALHDELYERGGTPQATGRGALADERARADALVDGLLARVAGESLWTTTDEELEVLRPLAARAGLELAVPRAGRLSALVGDVVRVCRLRRSEP